MKAVFPWFGGKSRVAPTVWERFGDVPNYVEPFFGSGAVLLGRPHPPGIETVNDLDGYICNFFRAIQADPEGVASYADQIVNENDLHARHAWLMSLRGDFTRRLEGDRNLYDTEVAGTWVWCMACWIGGGLAGPSGVGPWVIADGRLVRNANAGGVQRGLPHLGDAGRGVTRKCPHLGDAGQGVQRKRPHLGNVGLGVQRKRPHLGDAGRGVQQKRNLGEWFTMLHDRLERTRVCCGDWKRVMGPAVTFGHGVTGVFLDPPYGESRQEEIYACDSTTIFREVREWCLANGSNPLLRIALCGYAGEGHEALEGQGWTMERWKAPGGYANLNKENQNAARERIWFSPACLRPGLF